MGVISSQFRQDMNMVGISCALLFTEQIYILNCDAQFIMKFFVVTSLIVEFNYVHIQFH